MIDSIFEWNSVGFIHTEWDARFVMDDFGNATEVAFSGCPSYFQDH